MFCLLIINFYLGLIYSHVPSNVRCRNVYYKDKGYYPAMGGRKGVVETVSELCFSEAVRVQYF
jgi:hypothetical protein